MHIAKTNVIITSFVIGACLVAKCQADTKPTLPLLRPPYTLTYDVNIEQKSADLDVGYHNPITDGTVTVSNNGKQFLYVTKFGSWQKVVLYDIGTKTAFSVSNESPNAKINSGLREAFSNMKLLPFPGLGYDLYPLVDSVTCSNGRDCKGSVVVAGDTDENVMAYRPGTIHLSRSNSASVIGDCEIVLLPSSDFPQGGVPQTWRFSKYTMLGSTPIAGDIIHESDTVNEPAPPYTLKPDGRIHYTLTTVSSSVLDDDKYVLETYLTPKNTIEDHTHSKFIPYYFDPQGGPISDQTDKVISRDKRHVNSLKNGRERSSAGLFAMLALGCAVCALTLWRRGRK